MNTLAYEQGLKRAAMGRPVAPSLGDVLWYTQPSRGVETSTLQFGEFQRVAVVTANAASVPGKGGIHKKHSDADGDGKTGEGKKKIRDFSDKDGNGKPDVFEVSSSESSSEYTSDSDEEAGGGMAKKRSNASAGEDCGCGCGGDPEKKKDGCGSGLKKGISKASKKVKREKHPDEGKIHRANDGKHGTF